MNNYRSEDKIIIKGLTCFGRHGVLPEERTLGQKFRINCTLSLDFSAAAAGDDLLETVNYAQVCADIKKFTEETTFELIETLAHKLCGKLLRDYPVVNQAEVEVQKPWAPIGLPLDTASVRVSREKHTVYIALGSNIGDRKKFLDEAVKALNDSENFNVIKVSDYINTKPYGKTDQADFLNAALQGETLMRPRELLAFLHGVEEAAGRERTERWGPRTLDLDIIFYDDLVLDSADLIIPHKEMHLRDFVLEPLSQIAPWVRHPVFGKTVSTMLQENR